MDEFKDDEGQYNLIVSTYYGSHVGYLSSAQ